MKVKICGIRNLKELEMVEIADFTGVVVRAKSKRAVDLDTARMLISKANIPVFAVSTASTFGEWMEIIEKCGAEYIQVHSDMSFEEFERLRSEFGGVISKAFKVPRKSDNPEKVAEKTANLMEMYKADYYLLDTGKGSGITHDHRVSREVVKAVKRPVILAGGLNPDNVAGIAGYVKPFGVDVSSGVEGDDGKDASLIRLFAERAKGVIE